jgi:6-phosphogluconolactonase (cycloisomerase 2 family)
LPGSTRPLSGGSAAAPAEVQFNPDGSVLAVTEKDTNIIDTYIVGSDGLATGPVANMSVGIEPFGFAFSHSDILVDSETFQGAPALGAASSYRVANSGELQVISPSVRDTQSAPCWLIITDDHRFAFVTNTASGSVSSYQVAADGSLTLLNAVAASPGPVSFPVDMALTEGSRFLYLIANNTHNVFGYRAGSDGSLMQVTAVGGLPPASQGIAAK